MNQRTEIVCLLAFEVAWKVSGQKIWYDVQNLIWKDETLTICKILYFFDTLSNNRTPMKITWIIWEVSNWILCLYYDVLSELHFDFFMHRKYKTFIKNCNYEIPGIPGAPCISSFNLFLSFVMTYPFSFPSQFILIRFMRRKQ